jgi:sulfoxide reductase catalytic subunit YedY
MTREEDAGAYINFYEFANSGRNFKGRVKDLAKDYPFRPWEVEIGGLVEKPRTMTIDEIEKVAPLEERLYRHRCVETWAMAVPWIGYSFSKLLAAVEPKPEAKFVRFVSWHDPELPGVKGSPHYPWPYFEGLRMDEAMNEITLLCTGIYGKPLAPQHGAPVRIVTPWKYGYKSIKSIAKIELVAEQPPTLWNTVTPHEYDFTSNVDPEVPHPRWSQAFEWMIPDQSVRRPTLKYNGYGEFVAKMYEG